MALKKETRPYETLIRHNADGTLGAQHTQIVEISDGGNVISAQLGDTFPLNVVDEATGYNLSAVLGETLVAAVASNTDLQGKVTDLNGQLAEAGSAIEQLSNQLATKNSAIEQLNQILAAQQVEIERLRALQPQSEEQQPNE